MNRQADRARTAAASRDLVLLVPVVVAVVLAVACLATPRQVEFSRLLPVAPALAAALWPVRATVAMGLIFLLGLGGYLLVDADESHLFTAGSIAAVTAAAAYASHQRLRREKTLVQVRAVADAAQAVLLRPVPERIGALRLDALYRSAAPHAQVGGDFFAVADTPHGIRLILGDVRGKGLPALAVSAALLGSFREAAHEAADLVGLARRLDATLERESTGDDENPFELFTTAVLVQIPHEGTEAELVNRGHPAPLLTSSAGTRVLDGLPSAPPLNLATLDPTPARPLAFPFTPGDRLLLYTDGVSETRSPAGDFFPLTPWASAHPDAGVAALHTALQQHSDDNLTDDIAALAVYREPGGRSPAAGRSASRLSSRSA